MEEDSWICVDETFSNDENYSDSDQIDSETEAELYSLIHFEGNLSRMSCPSSATKNGIKPDATVLSDKTKYVLSTEKSECNREIEFVDNSNKFLENGNNHIAGIENCDKNVSGDSLQKTFHEKEKICNADYTAPINVGNTLNSNQLAETQSSNDRNKRKFEHCLPIPSSPSKKSVTDSGRKIIWIDINSLGKKDIQTNICDDEDDDIIFISSEPDSDSEPDYSTPSKIRISSVQNMSMPNIKIGESSKDLWFVNQEDIRRARSIKSRRYHDKVDITCSNCNRKGHHSKICPLPKDRKCFICGGKHFSTTCKNRICGKCYKTGHERRSCFTPRVNICGLCHMHGHDKQNCPDLWRRYHLTTLPGKIVPDKIVKQNSFVFCYKCGRPGHFGAVCNLQYGGYKNCLSTWPNVLSYDEPYSLPMQTTKTTGNKQKKKELVIKRKKINPNEVEKQAKKAKIKKKKQLKHQELLNAKTPKKVLKNKDFPRTPKIKVNLPSPTSQKNNSTINVFNVRTSDDDDAVVILPTPKKIKKKVPVIDLTTLRTPKNNRFGESDDLPESARQFILAKEKRKERNRKRRLKRRQNRFKERNDCKNNKAT